jgi:hypothetical protein
MPGFFKTWSISPCHQSQTCGWTSLFHGRLALEQKEFRSIVEIRPRHESAVRTSSHEHDLAFVSFVECLGLQVSVRAPPSLLQTCALFHSFPSSPACILYNLSLLLICGGWSGSLQRIFLVLCCDPMEDEN